MNILITGPSLTGPGGVASYYSAVLPHLRQQVGFDIHYLHIGRYDRAGGILHPLVDQVRFLRALARIRPTVIHVNPSLNLKSYIRDGLFIYQAKRRGYPVVVFSVAGIKNLNPPWGESGYGFSEKPIARQMRLSSWPPRSETNSWSGA